MIIFDKFFIIFTKLYLINIITKIIISNKNRIPINDFSILNNRIVINIITPLNLNVVKLH